MMLAENEKQHACRSKRVKAPLVVCKCTVFTQEKDAQKIC